MIRINAVAHEGDLEPREAVVPKVSVGCRDGLPRPKKQSPVQAAGGDCVSDPETPAGKEGLHDLEAVRDPLHAAKKRPPVHAGLRCSSETEHDLRLNARLDQ